MLSVQSLWRDVAKGSLATDFGPGEGETLDRRIARATSQHAPPSTTGQSMPSWAPRRSWLGYVATCTFGSSTHFSSDPARVQSTTPTIGLQGE